MCCRRSGPSPWRSACSPRSEPRPARQERQPAHRSRSCTQATGTCETGKACDPAVPLTLPGHHLRRDVMNERTGMADDAGASEAAGLDAQGAAVIMQEARERARHGLTVNRPVIFVSWALVYLLGYGVASLSHRRH